MRAGARRRPAWARSGPRMTNARSPRLRSRASTSTPIAPRFVAGDLHGPLAVAAALDVGADLLEEGGDQGGGGGVVHRATMLPAPRSRPRSARVGCRGARRAAEGRVGAGRGGGRGGGRDRPRPARAGRRGRGRRPRPRPAAWPTRRCACGCSPRGERPFDRALDGRCPAPPCCASASSRSSPTCAAATARRWSARPPGRRWPRRLVEAYAEAVAAHGVPVARGRFGATMAVSLENDGPVTIVLDSAEPPAGATAPLAASGPEAEGAALGVAADRPALAGVDDRAAELGDALQRGRDVGHREVGEGDPVAGPARPGGGRPGRPRRRCSASPRPAPARAARAPSRARPPRTAGPGRGRRRGTRRAWAGCRTRAPA